ncbi:MAG: hypothetical protein IPQ05_18825 [Leptospiraceae bacterium]|nr:hypothetical protein [Leptospiraceae bacterium]MBK7055151.1 hypothetical protein [Leptospiraceae bacterium]MBK9498987.1 hypothetical protein [Leptospiraceae bacterium]MBL0265859.1 hypothetical protein [Leptospiraceae bacterium]MBP9887620.1 hypothetical protein [Leptospiraceae bacterium]
MINNFEKIKEQLKELSEVVNLFKSEAVQLRIVELVFDSEQAKEEAVGNVQSNPRKKGKGKEKKSTQSNLKEKKTKPVSVGNGPVATLSELANSDFFKKPRTINDIIEHCDRNLARRFKTNEISSKLARMVRNKELERTKNSDNQYEYKK